MIPKKLIRCFIALEMSREAIENLEEVQKLIGKQNLFLGKFTEPENLHLTLKFLGEIEEEKVEEVRNVLKNIKLDNFKIKLGCVGVFSKKAFKIVWIKLEGKSIWELQEKIDLELEKIGFKKEERFMSHVTLARIKKVYNKDNFLKYIKNLKIKETSFEIKEFVFKKSELKPEGPVYTDLERFNLI